jgi:hypothetical protein
MNRFLTLLAFLVLASSAFASSTTCLAPDTAYASYMGGFTCVSGNLMFSGFDLHVNVAGSPGASGPTAVKVTPELTTGNEGFSFRANWAGNMDTSLSFTVTALVGLITDVHLTMTGGSFGPGSFANVSESICRDGNLATCVPPNGTPGSLIVPNSVSPISDAIFFSGAHSVQVSKDISVFAGPNGGANISVVTNTYSQSNVPEPLSLALFGSGLVGLGLMRKRAKR